MELGRNVGVIFGGGIVGFLVFVSVTAGMVIGGTTGVVFGGSTVGVPVFVSARVIGGGDVGLGVPRLCIGKS